MNKNTPALFLALLLAINLPVHATDVTGFYLGAGQNQFIFDEDRILDDENDFYINAGYQFSNHWGFDLEYSQLDSNLTSVGTPAFSTEFVSLNSRYRYRPRNESSFFWKLGVGEYDQLPNNGKRSMARLGGGYDWSLTDRFSLVAGVDALASFSESNLDWVPYVGLNYTFSKAIKKAKPIAIAKVEPSDSDKDGVIDVLDQCPDTPANTPVNKDGCEIDLDTDKDGVPNSIDKCLDTPLGAKVDATGCRIILKENVSITLNVQFANNSNLITEEYRSDIGRVAQFMQQYPDTTVVIEGHTDSKGAANYNQNLSQRRADAVMQYLIKEFNINSSRLSALGKGEEMPIASNDTAEGRAKNRRVQAEIKTVVTKIK